MSLVTNKTLVLQETRGIYHAKKPFCSPWSTRMDWVRPNSRSSPGRKSMRFGVLHTGDQCLVQGATFTFQIMQTEIPKVAVTLVSPINAHQDSRKRFSRVLQTLLLQITRCSDFSHE